MKYKAGDKVKVRDDLIPGEHYGNKMFMLEMSRLRNTTVTIKTCNGIYYEIKEDLDGWCWTDEMFEEPKEEKSQPDDSDNVHHPLHYTYGKIECIDFIMDKQLNFPLGNAVKYLVRAGHKKSSDKTDTEKQIEDLQKAIQYITFEIEHLEGRR